MNSAEQVRAHLHALHEAVWELAAIAVALGDPPTTDPDQRRAAERVLLAAGLMEDADTGARPGRGLADAVGANRARFAAQASTAILQTAALLSGADAWTSQNDEAILAQGRSSAQTASAFKAFVIPSLEGLHELLSGSSPVMLDVGVGVAAMAVAYCEAFPGLRVVGLDVFPRALELAHRTVDEAALTERIELRLQDVATLEDRDVFCLAWLPAPFLPRSALEAGLPRVVRSLVPGGWVVVGHGKLGTGGLSDALTGFQTVAFGGTAMTSDQAQDALRAVGLQQVATIPTPRGAPALTVGRTPPC